MFDVARKPWVTVASADEIERQVSACPSGALSFERLDPAS